MKNPPPAGVDIRLNLEEIGRIRGAFRAMWDGLEDGHPKDKRDVTLIARISRQAERCWGVTYTEKLR